MDVAVGVFLVEEYDGCGEYDGDDLLEFDYLVDASERYHGEWRFRVYTSDVEVFFVKKYAVVFDGIVEKQTEIEFIARFWGPAELAVECVYDFLVDHIIRSVKGGGVFGVRDL